MAKRNNKQLKIKYAAFVLGALLVFVWAAKIAYTHQLTGLELNVYSAINNLPPELARVFLIITQFGSAWMLFALTLLLVWRKRSRLALRTFALGATAFITTEVLKRLVTRPRPLDLIENADLKEVLTYGYGFPSGHTAIVTAVSLVVMPYIPSKFRWLGIAWIALVGLSRIYLGVHSPLDIVGGIAVGVIVVYGSYLVKNKLLLVSKITHTKMTN